MKTRNKSYFGVVRSITVVFIVVFSFFLTMLVSAEDDGYSFGFEGSRGQSQPAANSKDNNDDKKLAPAEDQKKTPEEMADYVSSVIGKVKDTKSSPVGTGILDKNQNNKSAKVAKEKTASEEGVGQKEADLSDAEVENEDLNEESKDAGSSDQTRPSLSLIVSALPEDSLVSSLEELGRITRNQKVEIGEITIVGYDDVKERKELPITKLEDESQISKEFSKGLAVEVQLKKLGVETTNYVDFKKIKSELQIDSSPTWLLKYKGITYIYEGINNPSKLFTQQGEVRGIEESSSAGGIVTKGESVKDNLIRKEKVRGVEFIKANRVEIVVPKADPSMLPASIKYAKPEKSEDDDSEADKEDEISEQQAIARIQGKYGDRREGREDRWSATVFIRPDLNANEEKRVTSLPECSVSNVRRREVFDATEKSEIIDVLYYNPKTPTHLQQLPHYRRGAAPFNPKYINVEDLPKYENNPEALKQTTDVWTDLAIDSKVSCLPTRLHFVKEGGRRYLEFIEGPKAWE